MTPWPVLLLYVYGALLIVGGVMGYVKAKSVPSVAAGVICGLIAFLLGANYTWHDAPYAALVLALVLIFLMGRRYLRTRKAMPALLIVGLSVIVVLAQLYVLIFIGPGHDPL
ncbi:MAG: TMEM14 family protein [Methylacidiphilales bacterium]|nr:TMEM14 family protein [Candidatus Methylacidiphilales bacterium]